jgi:hypothetical protein
MWSFAALGLYPDAKLVQAMTREAVAKSREFKPQGIANLMWAFAVLDSHPGPGVVSQLLSDIGGSPAEQDWGPENKHQLHQFFLWHGLQGLEAHKALAQECHQSFAKQSLLDTANRMSETQRQVSTTLRSMGVGFQEEKVLPGNGYSVDMLLDGEGKVVVEVDGPSHYVNGSLASGGQFTEWRSKGLRWNGATQLKDRLLRGQGWTVLHVPYYEWGALSGAEQRSSYLEGILALATKSD